MASPSMSFRNTCADTSPLSTPLGGEICQNSRSPTVANEYVVNPALSHCDSSVANVHSGTHSSSRQQLQICTLTTSTGQPPPPSPPPLLAPVSGMKGKVVKPRVISKHMMRQSSPPPILPPTSTTQQCTLLNPPSGPVVLHQPQSFMMQSQDSRRRSSGYQSTVSSLRSRSSSPLPPPLPSPTSCSPRRISVGTGGVTDPRGSLMDESSICPRCGRCRCQQCREPQPLPRRRVYGRCVVSDKCCVDVLSCMVVAKYLFDHACCCFEDDGRLDSRKVPGITVSSHGGGKSSVSGYGGMEFSSDSGVWWGGPSSSISYGGVSFVYEDEPTTTSVDNNGDTNVSPRPSTATNDWIQQAAAVSTPPPRLSDDPLACTSRPLCCPRWTALTCLSLCLPCLCLYPAFQAGAKAVQWCYNKNVGLRGCQCKPSSGAACYLESGAGGGVGFVKEREETSTANSPGRCLFIVMEDTGH